MTQPKQQVFEGVRVIDFVSRKAGAAIAGALMADFGAAPQQPPRRARASARNQVAGRLGAMSAPYAEGFTSGRDGPRQNEEIRRPRVNSCCAGKLGSGGFPAG